ncbi:hypothetical protein [Planomonospora sp. ID82291]|uniref:hypothetical protein n=1 Tax=Planomonospora sp. ID82291 TaxID=2738136 RepID=UPI0018C4252A|nr:hypothetical protein [Planomonospora sp. ID82291]MBG0818487.1 hypothetical protein [Planomonospora sp. ID82291]
MHPDITPGAESGAGQDGNEQADVSSQRGSRAQLFARIAARHNPHLNPAYLAAALAERDQDRAI